MKICPDCRFEYRSHVETCADCGAALLPVEEHARREEEKRRLMEQPLEDPVAIREGEVPWMGELHDALIGVGIPCRVFSDPGCGKGCSGSACKLLVSRRDAERAHERCEEYFAEIYPEAQASRERMSQGKCPACGSDADPAAAECPDCGLTLHTLE